MEKVLVGIDLVLRYANVWKKKNVRSKAYMSIYLKRKQIQKA